jgi:hypothetical protein
MKITAFFALLLVSVSVFAADDISIPEPSQNPGAVFRLYRTQNIHTLLKLDTRTGQVWQVQLGDEGQRFQTAINRLSLVEHTAALKPGRFTLYPTPNIFTFVLVDQDDGRIWQLQWGKDTDRFVIAVPKPD